MRRRDKNIRKTIPIHITIKLDRKPSLPPFAQSCKDIIRLRDVLFNRTFHPRFRVNYNTLFPKSRSCTIRNFYLTDPLFGRKCLRGRKRTPRRDLPKTGSPRQCIRNRFSIWINRPLSHTGQIAHIGRLRTRT